MHRLIQDLRYATRGLIKAPLFTVGVVLTLALGIGVNATMFGVVDTLFLRPPPGVSEPGRIVRVYFKQNSSYFGWYTQAGTSYPAYLDLRDHVPAFVQAAAISGGDLALGRGAGAIQVKAAAVSAPYFAMLGVRPALGRFFASDEDRVGGAKVAVLSYGFWQRHFGGDSSVVGRLLPLGQGRYTVIGVGPRGFGGIDIAAADLFIPIVAAAADVASPEAIGTRHWTWLEVIAKLGPGVRASDAASQATYAYRNGANADPEDAGNADRLRQNNSTLALLGPIQEARGPQASSDAKVSAWIGMVGLVVLLIACANVANLLLARGLTRRRELAVRASLGAGRAGLIRLLLAESLLLAGAGGIAALALVEWGGAITRRFLLPELSPDAPIVDGRALLFTGLAVLATTLLIGLIPSIQASRTDLVESLKSGGHGLTRSGGRTRAALLVAQLALTLTLLVGAGLFVRSLRNVEAIDLGFDADRVLMVHVDLSAMGLSTAEANDVYLRLMDRVRRITGVERTAVSMGTPFGSSYGVDLRAEGRDSMPHSKSGGPYFQAVTPDYLPTLGTRVLRGRGFTGGDVAGADKVAVVGATFARMVWPGQAAIGKCLYLKKAPDCVRVIGVAADAKRGQVTESETLLFYVPLAQYADDPQVNALFVRTHGDAAHLIGAVRREVQVAGNFPYAGIQSLSDRIAPQLRSWRLGASAFTAFGLLALLIASMGIFAVISYGVSQRVKEIGIRVALGAQSRHVVRMVVAQGIRTALIGVAFGALGALALGRAVTALLYQVAPTDHLVFGSMTAVILAVAIGAAYLPARRASRVSPMTALRSE
jgi:predicted permease